jgi:hypothetical protein
MSTISDFLSKAIGDYSQLVEEGSPLNKQWQQFKGNISQNVPPTSTYKDPRELGQWAQSAALNAPMIGAIRGPRDVMAQLWQRKQRDIPVPGSKLDNLNTMWENYYKKSFATENDPIVKYIDSGGNVAGHASGIPNVQVTHYNPNKGDINDLLDTFANGIVPKGSVVPSNARIGPMQDVLDNLRLPDIPKRYTIHAERYQNAADALREARGTKQIATTPAGKYFENINDFGALQMATKKGGTRHTTVADMFNTNEYLKRNPDVIAFIGRGQSVNHMNDVLPGNASRMSITDALEHANNYDLKAHIDAEKALRNEEMLKKLSNVEPVHKFTDGTSWNKVNNDEALRAEGIFQGHCVGSYCDKVAIGKSKIYSLRNSAGMPILTAEYNPITNKMVQIKGKYNVAPEPEFAPHIKELKNLLGL